MGDKINMKCNQNKKYDCNNIGLEKCNNCIAPVLCFCTRKKVVNNRKKLWREYRLTNQTESKL